jgi:hypothetical protein
MQRLELKDRPNFANRKFSAAGGKEEAAAVP